jgi:hypothetical protein
MAGDGRMVNAADIMLHNSSAPANKGGVNESVVGNENVGPGLVADDTISSGISGVTALGDDRLDRVLLS